jgi:choline-glycine betaine transporter
MLLVGDGDGDALSGLQNLTIIVAAPFALIMVGLCWALWRDLRTDPLMVKEDEMLKALREADVSEVRRRFRVGR